MEDLDITINLSKPEKDPKAIAAVLEDAGVYKWDAAGRRAFKKFVETVNG